MVLGWACEPACNFAGFWCLRRLPLAWPPCCFVAGVAVVAYKPSWSRPPLCFNFRDFCGSTVASEWISSPYIYSLRSCFHRGGLAKERSSGASTKTLFALFQSPFFPSVVVSFHYAQQLPRLCLPPVPLIMVLGHTSLQSVGEKNRFLAGPRLLHPTAFGSVDQ